MRYKQPKKFHSYSLFFHINRVFTENKRVLLCCFFFLFLGLLTGIFVVISSGGKVPFLSTYSLNEFSFGNIASFRLFMSRMFSYVVVLCVVYVSSFHVVLVPLSFFAIAYRTYLLGINCTLIIRCFGLSGIMSTFFIIFPCQLMIIILMCLFVCNAVDCSVIKRKFCKNHSDSILGKLFLFFVLITMVNILETLLLKLFSGNVFLVI